MPKEAWELQYTNRYLKNIKKLDKPTAQRITSALDRLATYPNPQGHCKALTGEYAGLSRYRVGNYRVIVSFQATELIILALEVGHRSRIYNR
ncbi:type II toxin-antitoxin system RelE/ParE family toxin [Rothia nasimurium]|uniref:Type II toxin-antitoxin system RelE/ParE family toxin n=1 Tax=Rothia nasimurium TaxID=85336 RepID=A0A4Y9F2K5_9MICC|nr:type II toxin-antitoxin system RelE/ParE family toxin [Rothia nasimurium]TFU21947.1 type II toxin-antitoxin system RelE/ParE family toxin [Rothia nasimurium]